MSEASEITKVLGYFVAYVLLVLAWARWARRARPVGLADQGERLGRLKRRGSARERRRVY